MIAGRSSIVITVFSTTSGIGKTLVATNLAAGLAQAGNAVCLIDLDLQYGDVANYLNLRDVPTIADIPPTAPPNQIPFYLSEYRRGNVKFSVLPAPFKIEDSYRVEERTVISVINHLDAFNFIIVDTKSEFNDMNMAVMDVSTIINFLCVADFVPAIKNLKSGYEAILRFGYDVNKVRPVLNRSDSQTLIDPDDVEAVLGKDFYHRLSNDFKGASNSIRSGCPLVLAETNSRLKKDIVDLVGLYTNRKKSDEQATGGGIVSFFKRLFR